MEPAVGDPLGAHSSASSPAPLRRRRHAARIPQLQEGAADLVSTLANDLLRETAGRERFAGFSEPDIRQAADSLVRYRLSTLEIIRHTERDARRLFLAEIREAEGKSFPELHLLMQLFSHFQPIVTKLRANAKDPAFEELVIPRALARYTADLSGLGGFLKPNQLMVNYVSRELARGKLQVPSYTPYIVPAIAEVPWPVASAEHKAAATKWTGNRQAAKAAQFQPLPLNAWLLYQLRFILAADICGAWTAFGGIAAQLNHLSIVLHIATTEAIGTALTYDSLLKAHSEELARSRANGTAAGSTDFHELLSNEQHRFKLQAIHQHVKAPKPVVEKEKKKKEVKEKDVQRKPDWIPRKEYLKKLAEDRKAAENARKPPRSPPNGRYREKRRSVKRPRSAQRTNKPEPKKRR